MVTLCAVTHTQGIEEEEVEFFDSFVSVCFSRLLCV